MDVKSDKLGCGLNCFKLAFPPLDEKRILELQSVWLAQMAGIADLLEESRAEVRRLECEVESRVGHHLVRDLQKEVNNLRGKRLTL